jgi:restriction endonuclease S subunit
MKKGWKDKSVGEILQLEYGKPLDDRYRKPDGLYPVYGANGEKDRTDKFYFAKPTIIVGRKGSAGELNLTEPKFWPLDVTYFVTFDEQQHDLRFLYYLLTTLELTKLAKGVKPGINRNEVYSQTTKVPPLTEQQRIVGILDEAFAGIATAKANAEKNLQNARELFESHLHSVFTQRGQGWVQTTLGDVCEFENGDRGKNYPNRKEYVESGIPWINTGHIQPDGFLSQSEMNFISKEKYESLRGGKIQPGDLVYCLRGATLGKTALVSPFTVGAVASSVHEGGLFLA